MVACLGAQGSVLHSVQIVLGQGVPHPLLAAILNSQGLSHEQTRVCVHIGLFKERDLEGGGGRERETETQTDRERQAQRERDTERDRDTERHRMIETERHTHTKTGNSTTNLTPVSAT